MFCEEWDFPYFPNTVPEAIALYVIQNANNAAAAAAIVDNLAEAYDRIDNRPWRDALVRTVVEAFSDEPTTQH